MLNLFQRLDFKLGLSVIGGSGMREGALLWDCRIEETWRHSTSRVRLGEAHATSF